MNLKRKIEILGLEIPIFLIVAALIAAPASAALLNYYGTISGTSTVEQSILVDEKGYNDPITGDYEGNVVAGNILSETHLLQNNANVPATVNFETTHSDSDGITTSYSAILKDDNTWFGNENNMRTIVSDVGATLGEGATLGDLLGPEGGLQYNYTVMEAGENNGASPITFFFNLADGRHVLIYPGYGDRSGEQSLVFGSESSYSTTDDGTQFTDFVLYDENWNEINSKDGMGGFAEVIDTIGSDIQNASVETFGIMHQGANTGQKDRLDYFELGPKGCHFTEGSSDTLEPDKDYCMMLVNEFAINLEPKGYAITTEIKPV